MMLRKDTGVRAEEDRAVFPSAVWSDQTVMEDCRACETSFNQ